MTDIVQIKAAHFYRTSNSLLLSPDLREKIVFCCSPPNAMGKGRFTVENVAKGITYTYEIDKYHIIEEVPSEQVYKHKRDIREARKCPTKDGSNVAMMTNVTNLNSPQQTLVTPPLNVSDVSGNAQQAYDDCVKTVKPSVADIGHTNPIVMDSSKGKIIYGDFPWVKNPLDTIWVQDRGGYAPRDAVVYVKAATSNQLAMNTNSEGIKFVRWYNSDKTMTYIRCYPLKDSRLMEGHFYDTFAVPGRLSDGECRKYLDEVVLPSSKVKELGVTKPFRLLLKRTVLPMKVWKAQYKPNGTTKVYQTHSDGVSWYSTKTDQAFESLTKILDNTSIPNEFESISFAGAMGRLQNHLVKDRASYKGDYPCVEVYGIWQNYNAESDSFYMKHYDNFDVLMMHWQPFSYKEEFESFLL